MAKGQKRSTRELRKPKASKNKAASASPFITTSQAAKKNAPAKPKG